MLEEMKFVFYRWDTSFDGPKYFVVSHKTWVREILHNEALRPTRTELARGTLVDMQRLLSLTQEN